MNLVVKVHNSQPVIEQLPSSAELYSLARVAEERGYHGASEILTARGDDMLMFEMERSLDHEQATDR